MRVLLVEDDEMIGEAVADGLKGEGYAVDWVKDGNSAIIALDTTPFSLVILDLGLPGKDGLAVLKEIRFRKNHTPVLVTTARDTVNDRIEGCLLYTSPAGIDENQRQEDQGNDQHGEKRELRACAVPNRQRGDRVRRGRHQEREHRNERCEDSSDFS